jgi:malonate-semialdehyde dehydrogenase (acetylating)/methylmalonate-semialdehyde dehydrogenase
MTELKNRIGEQLVSGNGARQRIINPANGTEEIAVYNESTTADCSAAVEAAQAAFPSWRETPVVKRCRILFHIKELLETRAEEISEILVRENGKTMPEALAEMRRGIEVVEFAAGMPSLSKGDFIEDIAGNIDGFIYREPLGVSAGACPFNFPAMIPLWMVPVALACGNTFILKPSDKCPATASRIVDVFAEGGLPPGVLNLLQGGRTAVEALLADDRVSGFSFVGSTPAAEAVWKAGTAAGKRVQALGGAKNYLIVMPDADPKETVKGVIGSTYGCAGERCMASSVLVLVGKAEALLPDIITAAQAVQAGDGLKDGTDMGPLVTAEHRKKVISYIELGIEEGAELILDGRNISVPGLPEGYFLGPTIFDRVKPEMRIAREEIFGPVLSVMHARTLEEALSWANSSPFGNGASLFTSSGAAAHTFRKSIDCGMIGINAGVPAPMAFFSFGGHKKSLFGDLRMHGPDGIEFFTKKKAVIERWFDSGPAGAVWGR